MENRSNVQHHVVLGNAVVPDELETIGHDVAVRESHPLGLARRAAGVQQQRVVVFLAGPAIILG